MTDPATKRRSLFSFRIGGVQEFIDSARTTADFWAKSYLISHLSETAVKTINRQPSENKLIFPAPEILSNPTTTTWQGRFPNGVLAVIQTGQEKILGDAVQDAIQNEWQKCADEARSVLESHQLPTSLQPHEGHNSGDSRKYWEKLSAAGRQLRHRFRANEMLCAVCLACRLAKRVFFDTDESFPSRPHSTESSNAFSFTRLGVIVPGSVMGEPKATSLAVSATVSNTETAYYYGKLATGFIPVVRIATKHFFSCISAGLSARPS
jgi:hypothetical protein